ncbi:serine/threonine-protein kinase-like protein At3g51990 [Rutidosis leptorrhynchoides]|uniref:serine/threonine-protein kinase-like protein At3g51990 n=1 Tax=Rutidosis leptorrhynchoides TaxID=125765 RepID=UPI003A991CBB
MGYLSCKADSAVAISSSPTPNEKNQSSSSKDGQRPVKIQHFDYSDLEAATNGFSDQKLLGKGSHGRVYKAVVRGRHVAVKKPSRNQEIGQEVDNEIEILSKIQSPRLVNLVGISNDTKDRLLVVEFMCNGTLYDVLHSNSKTPNWGRRIRLALQIAKAVDILHSQSPPIIHRDIKSANVLIDRNLNARLGDFGLAMCCGIDDFRLRSTPPAGTMGYLDPCYVTPDNLSTKTDVFSFGILLLEIISGRKAIDISHSPPSIVDWAIPLVKRGKLVPIYDPRIPLPKDLIVRKQLAVIAAKCVRSCRERRPSMKEIVDWLTGLCKFEPLHSWNGFNNPCMMVESVGRPVEIRRQEDNDVECENLDNGGGLFNKQAIKNSSRVYSDLGIRSNLMELMAGASEDDSDSNRFGSPRAGNVVKEIFHIRQNYSVGRSSELKYPSRDRASSRFSCSGIE